MVTRGYGARIGERPERPSGVLSGKIPDVPASTDRDSGVMNGQSDPRRNESVSETLGDFWANRPVRPRRASKIGGVSAAIGLRYGVDPVLIRVVFVVSALYGGAGVLLYLLGWLLLPKEGDPVPGPYGPRPRRDPNSVVVVLLLVLLLIPVLLWASEYPSVLVVAALGLVAVFLLHRNYRHRGVSTEPPATGSGEFREQPGAAAQESTVEDPVDPRHPHGFATTPPDWRPAVPAQPGGKPRKPRRHSITLVTTVLALASGIAAGMLGAPLFATFAIPLGVLGLGMIVGAFLRGGRGLIVLAVPVGAAAMLISVLPTGPNGYPAPFDAPWRGAESVHVHPKTEQQLQPDYRTSVGEIELDLTDLPLDGRTVHTTASSQLGRVDVVVPRDVDVDAKCSTKAGSVSCLDEQRAGTHTSTQVHDTGPDGPGGGQLQLDLSTSTGEVEISRD